ncbi:porin [Caballeronia hypogeia]|uniref:Porin n=1 Tax=Caballeronia hypogeia TaxID=1777140 RepID=A0A158BMK3_9BURK|nr:hypothetical protein [Caballeronia hypogeia]SAK71220.1 porin [Caballeronia hypogeia]
MPALSLGAAYSYTVRKPTTVAAGKSKYNYHQFGVQANYALSKHTDLRMSGVMQIASGGSTGEYPAAAIFNPPGTYGASSGTGDSW